MYTQAADPTKPKGKTRFFESYRDPRTHKMRTVSVTFDKNTTATRRTALDLLRAKIRRLTAAPDTMTLSDLIERYTAYQRATYKPSTCLQNEMHLRGVMDLIGADALLSALTAGHITDVLNRSGKSATWKNGKLKHLKALIRWGYEQEYVASTDCIDRIKRFPEPPNRIKIAEKYMERQELKALIDGMGKTQWALLTRFLAASGLRIGEAMALTVADVNLGKRTLTVNKTYALNTDNVQSTKTTASDRVLHLRPELLEICKTTVMMARRQAAVYGYTARLLFANDTGDYISYDAYAKYFRENTERILGRRLSVHSLRHTFTSLMAESGIPLETISRQLGHIDSRITKEIYMHVTDTMRESENAALDGVSII